MSGCSCDRVVLESPDGQTVEGVMRPNDRCQIHGWPDDDWRAGHPLRRHAKLVDTETGDRVTVQQARVIAPTPWGHTRRFREETPRETEARLLAENRGDWPPLLEIAGLA